MSSDFNKIYEEMMKNFTLMTMQKMADKLDCKKAESDQSRTIMTCEEFLSLADSNPTPSSPAPKSIRPTVMSREEFLQLSEAELANLDSNFEPEGCYSYNHLHSERAEESNLRKLGYSVANNSELSEKQRQSLLQNAIEHGLVSKGYVITYLENNIRINGKKKSNSVALYKWKSDLEFVRNLK